MAKSKSKSKKSGNNNTSSAKNIKALIAQNKMTENQNAEAKREAEERREAREAEKLAKAQAEQEAAVKVESEPASEAATPVEADEVIVDTAVAEGADNVEADKATDQADSKGDKDKDKSKDKSKKAKKKKEKHKFGKKVKDTASELKKVTWPSFKEVVKKTGVVFAVVIFFGAVLLAFDFLMSLLYKLFIS